MKRVYFSLDNTTIADLEDTIQTQKRAKKPKLKSASRGRHVKWDPICYDLIREGKPLENTQCIDNLFAEKSVDESIFYLFRHKNTDMKRNETIPLYEAVYYCSEGFYVRAQKKHLTMAYRKAGRCRKARMWDIQQDGTPFCVDRHCFSMIGQRESKKRYESHKKQKNEEEGGYPGKN